MFYAVEYPLGRSVIVPPFTAPAGVVTAHPHRTVQAFRDREERALWVKARASEDPEAAGYREALPTSALRNWEMEEARYRQPAGRNPYALAADAERRRELRDAEDEY